jgi:hypothetical protein
MHERYGVDLSVTSAEAFGCRLARLRPILYIYISSIYTIVIVGIVPVLFNLGGTCKFK